METTKEKVLLFWSGGKDSALSFYELTQNPNYEVVSLITTFNRETSRVNYHGIPDVLVVEQAKLMKLPLQRVFLPDGATNADYEEQVGKILSIFARKGITTVAFGDIHLEDVRTFKENLVSKLGMKAIFPLWKRDSKEVALKFLSTGHKALVTSVYKNKLDANYLALEYNEAFLERLPEDVDPAGENGEFHTLVIFGPTFKMRLAFSKAIAVDEGPYLVSLIKEP